MMEEVKDFDIRTRTILDQIHAETREVARQFMIKKLKEHGMYNNLNEQEEV